MNVAKFGATVLRTPGYAESLFNPLERVDESGEQRTVSSLAGRYAAKEALAKSIGAPPGMHWRDCEVLVEPDGRPYLRITGQLREAANELGVSTFHLSLAMEGDTAMAYVIAEGSTSLDGVGAALVWESA